MPTMTSDGLFDLKSFEQPKTKKPEPKKERGGVAGFLERAAKSTINTGRHFVDVSITNPVKETAAQLTGNKKALANARKQSNVELGLGEKGTDFGGGVKNFIGNSAQLGANFIAPGGVTLGSKIIQGAKAGAVAGGGQALANDENVVEGVLSGAATGGAASGILGKVLGKKNPEAGSFRKNLKTQGQQMQARPAGFTSGSKVAGSDELVPQDTERMLQTLKNEGIQNTGNANTITRDVADKMKNYGKKIGDHFKVNDAPLNPADTKKIGDNFVESLGTTDERVLNEARILAQDLQKNVKSMKDLWNFRKSLDNRIPDSKQATGVTLSNQMRAIKDMRQYIANELGEVPGMKNYHDLAELRPFLAKGGRALNQGAGLDFWGRILSSGPVQKAEANLGKVLEKAGGSGASAAGQGGVLRKFIAPVADAPVLPAAAGMAAASPSNDVPQEIPPTEESLSPVDGVTDLLASGKGTDALGFGGGTPQTDSDPYSPANIQASVQSIIAQGGTQEDVAKFLSNAKVLAALTQTGKEKPLSAEAAKVVSNAQTGIRALRDFSGLIDEDPGAFGRTNIPGVGVLDRLTSGRASGALGTSSLNAARNQVIDVIARLRTGAAITNDEAARFESFVPQPGDDPTTRAQKIDYLLNQFQMVANRSGSAGTDMQQLLGESAL